LLKIWAYQGFSEPNFAHVIGQLSKSDVEIIKRQKREFEILPKRWIVEITFAWWNHYPRLSKDYELLVEMSEAMIYGSMIHIMLRRLAKLKQATSEFFRNSL
jgi:putative transposase